MQSKTITDTKYRFKKLTMYSKTQLQQLKHNFWIQFAHKYPRKWILHHTKIKDFSFKFYVDNKNSEVQIVIENKDTYKRKIYFDKLVSLKTILEEDYVSDLTFCENFILENGKTISLVKISLLNVSMNNTKNWDEIFDFFNEKMGQLELFFYEFQDYISDLETNV